MLFLNTLDRSICLNQVGFNVSVTFTSCAFFSGRKVILKNVTSRRLTQLATAFTNEHACHCVDKRTRVPIYMSKTTLQKLSHVHRKHKITNTQNGRQQDYALTFSGAHGPYSTRVETYRTRSQTIFFDLQCRYATTHAVHRVAQGQN